MTELDAHVEQQLADLSPEDLAALIARVRPPSFADQLKAAASQFLSGERLDAFVGAANLRYFASENGDIDAEKVRSYMTNFLGVQDTGKHGAHPPGQAPGEGGHAEAARRAGTAGPGADSGPGAAGRAEAAKRRGGTGGGKGV